MLYYASREVKAVAISSIGGGAYGVNLISNPNSRKGVAQVSVSDALQLMLAFGTFIVALIALIVELIKSQQKK